MKKDDFFFVKILNFFSFFLLVNSIPKFEDREIEVLTLTLRAQEGDDIPIFTFFCKGMLEKISTVESGLAIFPLEFVICSPSRWRKKRIMPLAPRFTVCANRSWVIFGNFLRLTLFFPDYFLRHEFRYEKSCGIICECSGVWVW